MCSKQEHLQLRPPMNCAEFRDRFDGFDTGRTLTSFSDPNYSAWCEHFHDCQACGDWGLAARVRRWGHAPEAFPCIHMAYRALETCDQHEDRAECHDLFIEHAATSDAYYLIKGQVRLRIDFCPWCGVKLPEPRRE